VRVRSGRLGVLSSVAAPHEGYRRRRLRAPGAPGSRLPGGEAQGRPLAAGAATVSLAVQRRSRGSGGAPGTDVPPLRNWVVHDDPERSRASPADDERGNAHGGTDHRDLVAVAAA